MSKSIINKKGITLIEVAIAITILLIGIVAAAQIFPLAVKVDKTAEQTTVASDLAQSEIEQVFSQSFDSITIGTIEPLHKLATSSTNPFYYYQRQTVVDYVDGNLNYSASATGLKRVNTTVYWTNAVTKASKNTNVQLIISQH